MGFHVTVDTEGEMQVCCCHLQMMTSPRLEEEGERSQCDARRTEALHTTEVNRTKPHGAVAVGTVWSEVTLLTL